MIAVRISTKSRNDQSLIRSAIAPETIEAVVATKTIWKNQSDMVAWPAPMTLAVVSASSVKRAISSSEAP